MQTIPGSICSISKQSWIKSQEAVSCPCRQHWSRWTDSLVENMWGSYIFFILYIHVYSEINCHITEVFEKSLIVKRNKCYRYDSCVLFQEITIGHMMTFLPFSIFILRNLISPRLFGDHYLYSILHIYGTVTESS